MHIMYIYIYLYRIISHISIVQTQYIYIYRSTPPAIVENQRLRSCGHALHGECFNVAWRFFVRTLEKTVELGKCWNIWNTHIYI